MPITAADRVLNVGIRQLMSHGTRVASNILIRMRLAGDVIIGPSSNLPARDYLGGDIIVHGRRAEAVGSYQNDQMFGVYWRDQESVPDQPFEHYEAKWDPPSLEAFMS